MPAWKSALIGLAIGLGIVLATSPIGLYMALGRENEPTGAFIAIGALWLVLLVLATVLGAIAPRVLGAVNRDGR